MIMIIQPPSAVFTAVRYNMEKVDQQNAELMLSSRFGALDALSRIRTEDYVNYLEAHSSASAKTKLPEFHAIISCKEDSKDKHELTEIASRWMDKMGYKDQPYLLFYHKDSQNNHIHIVSTRVGRNGFRLDTGFEKMRGYEALNEIMGVDQQKRAAQVIDSLLSYRFFRATDFLHTLQSYGYFLRRTGDSYLVFQYCSKRAELPIDLIRSKISSSLADSTCLAQLKELLIEKINIADPLPRPQQLILAGGRKTLTTKFTSPLAELLEREYGLQLLYHHTSGRPSTDYTLLDPYTRTIYSGHDLVSLYGATDVQQKASQSIPSVDSPSMDLDLIKIDIVNDLDDEAVFRRQRGATKRKKSR